MRLSSYSYKGQDSYGIVRGDGIVDLKKRVGNKYPDLLSILRGNIKYPFGIPSYKRKKINTYNSDLYFNSFYLRFEVKDKPGVLSSITKIFAKNKISIKNLIQKPNKKNNKASIIILTHENTEKNFNNLFKNLSKNKFVLKKPTFIRIEKT